MITPIAPGIEVCAFQPGVAHGSGCRPPCRKMMNTSMWRASLAGMALISKSRILLATGRAVVCASNSVDAVMPDLLATMLPNSVTVTSLPTGLPGQGR